MISDKNGEPKISLKPERVPYSNVSIETLFEKNLLCSKKSQTFIINTVFTKDPIFHFGYSENIQTTQKFEPQSAHFNIKQSSLHCTVAHMNDISP